MKKQDATVETIDIHDKKMRIKTLTGKALFKAVIKDVKPLGWWLVLAVLLSFGSVTLGVFAPMLLGQAVDVVNDFVQGMPFATREFFTLIIMLVAFYAGNALFSVCRTVLMNNVVSRHFTCKLRIQMSEKIKKLSVSYLDNTDKGELIERMTDDVSIIGNTVHEIIDLVTQGLFQLALIIGFMMLIDWRLGLIVTATVPLSLFATALLSRRMSKKFDVFMQKNGELYSVIDESYAGLKTVRAYKMQGLMRQRHANLNNQIRESGKEGYFIGALLSPLVSLISNIVYAAICLVGGYFAIKGSISVGSVVAIVLYSSRLTAPLESVANAISMFQRTASACRRVYGMLAFDEEKDSTAKTTYAGDCVQVNAVDFGYVPDTPIIKNFTVDVKKGETVALVGPTGGGKTTIVNLLMRFYDPDSGAIIIDDKNTRDYDRVSVRNGFAMVLQDTWLFSGSVAENVKYGRADATREEVVEACKASYCDSFVSLMPNGYDTVISEDASNVSQGQKQLLTIARAFLSNRPMLILDEATSNVDTRTEILLQKAMAKLMSGRTCFVIAHRLSTIVNADKILVVKDGEIIESGKHDNLMARNGFYADMFRSQYSIT